MRAARLRRTVATGAAAVAMCGLFGGCGGGHAVEEGAHDKSLLDEILEIFGEGGKEVGKHCLRAPSECPPDTDGN